MENRIRQIKVRNGQLIPSQSEVWIRVVPEHETATTDLRGRLIGPRCLFANTIEVAYPLAKAPPNQVPPGRPGLTKRVVIPEACLWEPESPFLYQGSIELWQDGQRSDQVTISHGLRYFLLGKDGVRINSRPLRLIGRAVSVLNDDDALALRQQGFNLLIVPVYSETQAVWEQADRLGFCVLGRVMDKSEETLRYLSELKVHASCLGWIIDEGKHPPLSDFPPKTIIGLDCYASSPERYVRWIDYLYGPLELASFGKPLLLKGERPDDPLANNVILGNVP
jgi:hypothetical protein